MDVTVGAEGPAGATGPQGPEGPEGIQGPAGPQGEQGLTGSDGRDGTSCTVLDDADGATIACTDGTIASVADGAQGLQGETGPKGSEGVPGPQGVQGEPGLPGVPGRDGKPGADGLSCWDLNNNGVFDEAQEDIDLDRKGTVLDCRGRDGQDGEQGPEGERGPPGPGLDYLNLTIYSPVGSANVSTSANLRTDILRLCGDNDGCLLRLISEMPDQSNEPDRAAILFLRVSTTSGFDEWRSSSLTAGGEISSGETRDGVVESLALGRSCRLQDSFTEPDGPIIKNYGSDDPWLDNGLSAYELVNVAQPRGTTCRLYITD